MRLSGMHSAQILGLMLTGIGFSVSVFSLVFLTTCSGVLVLGVPCTPNFYWPILGPGLGLQIVGVVIPLRSARQNPEMQTIKPG